MAAMDATEQHASDPSDTELVARAVVGDEDAFDAIVRRHSARVYGICWRYFGDATDAEDAAQAALLACYRGLRSYRGTAAFSTWLYRVTTNACHDVARRNARRPSTVPLDPERSTAHDPAQGDALDALLAAEVDVDLADALRQLDPEQRHAVVLRDVVGVGYAEIAQRQGVALGTAKSRVHRAHARLAELLDPDGNRSAMLGRPTAQDS